MPPAISVPGVGIWGAYGVRPAVGANAPAIPTTAYNANYLKPDPRSARTTPVAKPGGFKSVAGTFSASDAAKTGFVNEVAPSVYNANYLKTASPLQYPPISPPLSDQEAFKVLKGAEEGAAEVPKIATSPHHFNPQDVIEILKLLEKGEITDEQMEDYLVDANRMRAYAALTKQRPLTDLEQQQVDEIGARLTEEARQLVAEDVGFDEAKRGEIEALGAHLQSLPYYKAQAIAAGQEAENERLDMITEAKRAEGDIAYYQGLSSDIDLKIADVENELKEEYPGAGKKAKVKRRIEDAAALANLRLDKGKIDAAALEAALAQNRFEMRRYEAEAVRERYFNEAKARDLEPPGVQAALELAKITNRSVNPRFAALSSKANKQAQLTASAIEISRASPAAEDKKADAEFAAAAGPKGPVEEFIKFNLSPRTTDKKYFSNATLIKEWAEFTREYVKKDPTVVASPPWLLEKNRQGVLKSLFRSSKVPSEFKLELLHKAGYL